MQLLNGSVIFSSVCYNASDIMELSIKFELSYFAAPFDKTPKNEMDE